MNYILSLNDSFFGRNGGGTIVAPFPPPILLDIPPPLLPPWLGNEMRRERGKELLLQVYVIVATGRKRGVRESGLEAFCTATKESLPPKSDHVGYFWKIF